MRKLKKMSLGIFSLAMLCQMGAVSQASASPWTLGVSELPSGDELGAYQTKPNCSGAHRRHYLGDGIRVVIDAQGGLRFDNVRRGGASNITFSEPDTPVVANDGVHNRMSLTLVERMLQARIFFYDVAFVRASGSYGVAATSTHVRQNIQWDAEDGVPKDGYYNNNAYAYDIDMAVGGQMRWNSWASNSLEIGWGYQRLSFNHASDVRFSAPFVKLGSKFEFAQRWTVNFAGAYHFAGSRKEEITPVLVNIFGVSGSSLLLDTAFVDSGRVSGSTVELAVGYAFTKHWGASLNYEFKGFKTSRKLLSTWGDNSSVTGTWNERTIWFSSHVRLGVDYSF